MDPNVLVTSVAQVIGSLAWPAVVLGLLWRYRDKVAELIPRIKALWGAEFHPQQQPPRPEFQIPQDAEGTEASADKTPPPAGAQPAKRIESLERLRTKTVVNAEEYITKTLGEAPQDLLTFGALMFLASQYESIEGIIFASQVQLLENLRARGGPMIASSLRETFYEPAVERNPRMFVNTSFEQYMRYLVSAALVIPLDGQYVLSERGFDYLAWRERVRKPPRLVG